ncbi:kinase-like domain-containing protein [Diplogelasinospora grovesii]|uniref:non-specific serine/threonine protein kinase n=1 Tax=Diplogelasinospora grovesii TaxID=303347 RepID=A0AAN6NEP7_9PEZI|nr:kinase-like domain-containing protein [Diplogelasinospora grovesii]
MLQRVRDFRQIPTGDIGNILERWNSLLRLPRTSYTRPQNRHPDFPFPSLEVARYCPGGYHPVRIGDVFNNGKYKIVSKLGYGAYLTKRHVALKVLTADSFGHQKDTFELDILKHIKAQHIQHPGKGHLLGLLDEFEHHGPNGNHVCLVFKAMGPDLSKYRRLFPNIRIPLPLVKEISRQLLLALSYLHDRYMSNIKPQNILIESPAINKMFEQTPSEAFRPHGSPLEPPNDFYMASTQLSSIEEDIAHSTELSIRLADFGTSSWFNKHLTEWIQPQMLRAPEVILGADWDSKVDIWNLGLVIWELAEGRLLFDGTWTINAPYSPEAHLAQMTAVFGSVPKTLLARSKNRDRYFDADGKLLEPSAFPPCSLEQFSKNPDNSESEKKKFLSFIDSMIRLDPEERLDATRLLESEWLRFTP